MSHSITQFILWYEWNTLESTRNSERSIYTLQNLISTHNKYNNLEVRVLIPNQNCKYDRKQDRTQDRIQDRTQDRIQDRIQDRRDDRLNNDRKMKTKLVYRSSIGKECNPLTNVQHRKNKEPCI